MLPSTPFPAQARIVIVGGGYSGAAAAVQLVRAAPAPLVVTIVEPRAEPGPGLAYSARDPDHRLNAPLDNHLVDPTDPGALARWCEQRGVLERDPDARAPSGRIFLRRADFGAYLADTVRAHASWWPTRSRIEHRRDVATGLNTSGAGVEVVTAKGGPLACELAIIATGNGATRLPRPLARLAAHPAVCADPLAATALEIPREHRVLVIGTGLTALDAISTLVRAGHEGGITAISRHGLRPRPQRPPSPERDLANLLAGIDGEVPAFVRRAPATARGLLAALRRRIAEDERRGESWYRGFDELRDVVWQVWPTLGPDEQRRFLARLRPWYDVHRFRSPPQNEALVREAEAEGRVAFRAGRIAQAEAQGAAIRVTWTDARGRHEGVFDAVINCTGLDPSCGARDNPFLAAAVAQGQIRADDCGMGFAVDAANRAIGADGAPNPRLRIVGPPSAGTFGDPLGAIFIAPQIRRMLPELFADLGMSPSDDAVREPRPAFGRV